MIDHEFESRVRRFDQARRVHASTRIDEFLGNPSQVDASARLKLLLELICIDLEYGWRAGSERPPITLEGYIAQFPELGSLDDLPVELIGEDYRCRCRWGDRPTHRDFLTRFRQKLEQIEAALIEIDREIAVELAADLPQSPVRTRIELETSGPLLSVDDYLLQRLIGAGAMGKVFEAIHRPESRPVAIKFLRKSLLVHPEVVQRFVQEARTIARLRHPGIVGTEGLGRTNGGSYFIVMDLIRGADLARISGQRTIDWHEAIGWMIETCQALEYAHEQGFIHCDLKPANLLLDDSRAIRLTDFGFARSIANDNPWALELEGTVPFMAPEQASPAWGPIDQRTDVYGVGAILFTLLTGRPPFVGRRLPDILALVSSATPVKSPARIRTDLPKAVVDFCQECLAKPKEDRFSTIRDARSALEAIVPSNR